MARSLSRTQALTAIDELRVGLDAALDEIEEQRRNVDLSIDHQSYLNDYAVVRIAGYLEQLCFHAISGRVGEVTGGHLQLFVNSWFFKSPNLTAQQLRDLFKRFGPDIDLKVKAFLDDGLNRELLDSLLETRNAVAHGKDYSQTGRASLQAFRGVLDELERLVRSLLLDEMSAI